MKFNGKYLKDIRQRAKMSQTDVVRAGGPSTPQQSRYENGKATPSPAVIYKLAGIFKVQVDVFFEDEDE